VIEHHLPFTKSASLVFALTRRRSWLSLVLTVSVRAAVQKVADAEEADAHKAWRRARLPLA